jgi:hypothetical protein
VAGLGRKVWTTETLSVPDMQGYLQDQTVMVFATSSARSAGVATPTEGMVSYLSDVDRLDLWTAHRVTGAMGWQPIPWGDTGWQPLNIIAPPAKGSDGADCRRIGSTGFVRAHVTYSSTWASGFVWTILPAWCRPDRKIWLDGLFYGNDARYEQTIDGFGNIATSRAVATPTTGMTCATAFPIGS